MHQPFEPELPLHLLLALSNVHQALESYQLPSKHRDLLHTAIANLNAHATRKFVGKPWPVK